MYVCFVCSKSFVERKDLMQHLRFACSVNTNIPCVLCETVFRSVDYYRNHLRIKHPNGNIFGPFRPPNWQEYQIANDDPPPQPPPQLPPQPQHIDADDMDFEFLEAFEGEELIPVNGLEVEADDAFVALVEPFVETCFNKWLEFVNHPDATVKAAELLCNMLMENAKASIHLAQPYMPPQQANRIESMLKYRFLPFTTEYRRRKYLEEHGFYAKPEEILTGIELITSGTPRGNVVRERRNMVAVIPMEKTLKSVLSIESLADSLVMPSNYTNSPTLCHPFAGRRAQNVFNQIGEDCLLVELYMDEFTTTCPIGNISTVYKMAAWYIRLLNLPLDMISQLDHIMLASVAHAVDVISDLQEILKLTLLPQFKKLETDVETTLVGCVEKQLNP
uniref:C2H2-type domain-containing protein n=1 Tax=Panagrolaimus superbus TaxID=310955 RepID=A0A914Z4I5_9BILA